MRDLILVGIIMDGSIPDAGKIAFKGSFPERIVCGKPACTYGKKQGKDHQDSFHNFS
jgi:hypothetical protein